VGPHLGAMLGAGDENRTRMASLEVFSTLWSAVEQTAVGLTLIDRRWPLMAAKCGPTVARRASHVRFLINRLPTLQTEPLTPCLHSGRAGVVSMHHSCLASHGTTVIGIHTAITSYGAVQSHSRQARLNVPAEARVHDRLRYLRPGFVSGAESDVLLMVRSKPIRTSVSAAAFKDPALASGRPARRPIPSQGQFPHHSTRVALIEASWSATTLRPKPTAMTVTMVVIIKMGSARAESAVPWKAPDPTSTPGDGDLGQPEAGDGLPTVTQQRV
jgi:hypothetical protein